VGFYSFLKNNVRISSKNFLLTCSMFIINANSIAQQPNDTKGDEISCRVYTLTSENYQFLNFQSNPQIKNPRAFINRKTGILTINFNFDFGGEVNARMPIENQILVRAFDKNEQLLDLFHTNETYTTIRKEYSSYSGRIIKIKPNNNVIRKPLNMAAAQYIKYLEFGFYLP